MDVPLWPALLIELCLLVLTLYTSLLDAVADGLSESRLERMKEDGDARAARLLDRFADSRAIVSAVHSALCLLQLAMGAVAAAGLARPLAAGLRSLPALAAMPERVLSGLCLVVVLLAICLLTRFIGVELPRRMAQRNIDALTGALLGPMTGLRRLLRPMTALIDALTGAVMRLMG